MHFRFQSCYWALFFSSVVIAAQTKIVYLNGTDVSVDNLKTSNVSASEPVKNWYSYSLLNPRNISNHSGKEQDEEEDNPLVTRDTTMLSSLAVQWRQIQPTLTLLSSIIGLFLAFVIIESPLSPLPVPSLPYPPIGPYPPTKLYPFGVPPVPKGRKPTYDNFRIPRHMNDPEMITEALESLFFSILEKNRILQHSSQPNF